MTVRKSRLALCLFASALSAAVHGRGADLNRLLATDCGAVADGKTLNTIALQKGIDQLQAEGGGVLVIPKGTFLSGSLFLKPGVELHLDAGAVLLGSNQIEDYPKRETRIEGHFEPWRMALVNAQGLDHVRISGPGRLNGNGVTFWQAFWQRRRENPKCTNVEVERPRLVFIDRCKDVHLADLELQDSGFWNLHVYHSSEVTIEGLRITVPSAVNGLRGPSTDGIDIDSCQNVTIRKCYISVGDDDIALKGSKGPFADKDADQPGGGEHSGRGLRDRRGRRAHHLRQRGDDRPQRHRAQLPHLRPRDHDDAQAPAGHPAALRAHHVRRHQTRQQWRPRHERQSLAPVF